MQILRGDIGRGRVCRRGFYPIIPRAVAIATSERPVNERDRLAGGQVHQVVEADLSFSELRDVERIHIVGADAV